MRIELLFHVLFLIFRLEVRFDQDRRKKSDRLIIATGQRQRGSRAARQLDYRCSWPC